ncbi:MAG: hypothetical protein JXB10_05605 [Pirellulales bacterium]|nr:hypothetical protein [Pirellulales bacterium]
MSRQKVAAPLWRGSPAYHIYYNSIAIAPHLAQPKKSKKTLQVHSPAGFDRLDITDLKRGEKKTTVEIIEVFRSHQRSQFVFHNTHQQILRPASGGTKFYLK